MTKQEDAKPYPHIVEELARMIEKGLERFPAEERKARLDRIHCILSAKNEAR